MLPMHRPSSSLGHWARQFQAAVAKRSLQGIICASSLCSSSGHCTEHVNFEFCVSRLSTCPVYNGRLSWFIFIAWTATSFALLGSLYLGCICRYIRPTSGGPSPMGGSALDLRAEELVSTRRDRLTGLTDVSGESSGGSTSQKRPLWESICSLVLFVLGMAFLPSWQKLSGSANLATVLGPAALMVVALCVGLSVQMVRLPVLWCDRQQRLLSRRSRGLHR